MTLDERVRLDPESRWQEVNLAYLDLELQRLRLLLHRRVLWLRTLWGHDPLAEYRGVLISDARADSLLAGEDRQAEARFYAQDPQAARIGHAIAGLQRDLEQGAQDGSTPALEVLVHTFGLTPFEREVVLLCLAPELDPAFERLFAYVQDDVTRNHATPHLALTLFGGDGIARQEARNSFLPESALRRFLLVILEDGPSPLVAREVRPMRLDGRVTDYLLGVNRPDERVADLLRPVPPGPLPQAHQDLVDLLQRSMESVASWGSWSALNLVGPPDAGKRTVARALCDQLGLRLYGLDAAQLPSPGPELRNLLRLADREAVLSHMAFYLDLSGVDPSDRTAIASVTDAIERLYAFVVVGSHEAWPSERETLTLHVPRPDADAQREIWRHELADAAGSLNGHLEAITQQFDFGPQTISRVVAAGEAMASLRVADGAPSAGDLWQACREQAGRHMGDLAQKITPHYTWEDIVLPEDAFRQLREISAQVANRSRVYEGWGFDVGRGRGISVLFSGPSGTGKTMAAEVLANGLELDLYRVDLAGVVSKYIGETEKNLRRVFEAAEQSGAVLFFDEADALFGKRSEVKDSHDRYANIEVNYLLQRMEDYGGLAILATNRKSALDGAFMRRLRFVVDFPLPAAEARRDIWRRVFPRQTPVDGLDYDFLSRLELSGGNIKNIALGAAFLAVDEDAAVGMDHVMRAARREYAKADKMITQREWGPYYETVRQ